MDVLVVGGFWIEFNFWIYSHEVNFHHTHVLNIYSTSRIDVIWRNLISEEFQQIEFNFWISTSLVKILYMLTFMTIMFSSHKSLWRHLTKPD